MSEPGFSVTQYEDVTTFANVVEPLIAADRGRSTIVATVLHAVAVSADPQQLPVLVVVSRDREPVGVAVAGATTASSALVTQLMSELLTAAEQDEVGALLASAFLGLDPAPAVVTGPRQGSQAFAAGYCATAGGDIVTHTELLLYRLDRLIDPVVVAGSPRPAEVGDAADLAVLARWRMEFAAATDAFPPITEPDVDGARRAAERGVTQLLWTVDGSPVSLAVHSAVLGGMVRIGPVYTPEALRGNGYAAAVTAAAVRSARAAGAADVLLFTDASNRTSNGVYQRIGFVECGAFAEVTLTPASGEPAGVW